MRSVLWDISYHTEILLRVVLAAICGIGIGLERGMRKKEAGQRTHSIIAVGAAAFTVISIYGFSDLTTHVDLSHLAAWIVSGISFLGVGIIYRSETFGISGLSTATGLWATAAIGIACGVGMYGLALFSTVFIILFHLILNATHMESFGYTVQNVLLEVDDFKTLQKILRKKKKLYRAKILSCEYTRNEARGTIIVRFRFRMLGSIPLEDIMEFIKEHEDFHQISI